MHPRFPAVVVVCVLRWLAVRSIAEAIARVDQGRADMDPETVLSSRGTATQEIVRVVESGRNTNSSTRASTAGPAHAG